MRELERFYVSARQLLLLGDALWILLASLLTSLILFGQIGIDDSNTFAVTAVMVGYLLASLPLGAISHRSPRPTILSDYFTVVGAWVVATLTLLVYFYFSKTGFFYSRLWFGLWFVITPFMLIAWRTLANYMFLTSGISRYFAHRAVIVHDGSEDAESFRRMLGTEFGTFKILRSINLNRPEEQQTEETGPKDVQAQINTIKNALGRNEVDTLLIAPLNNKDLLTAISHELRHFSYDILVSPSNYTPSMIVMDTALTDGIPLLAIQKRPLSGSSLMLKAIEDRLLGAALLLFFSPLMLLISLMIRLDSKGPALFKQQRLGFNNDAFTVYKFRTMTTMDDGSKQASKNDMRITRIGKWLRRTSLDELPQLINVVQGRMSLVGPRPHPVAQNNEYGGQVDSWLARHRMKPGITGWAQINGLRGEITNDEELVQRVEHDLYYIDHWSILFDLRILLATPLRGFVHPKAY